MKTILFILAFAFAFSAQAKTAEITCQPKFYVCINDGRGLLCEWQLLSGHPIANVELYQDEDNGDEVWRGTYITEVDGHRLKLDINYETELVEDGSQKTTLKTYAELMTPQVSASSSGSSRIDIGLHNFNYGRGYFCRSIRIVD